MIVDDATGSIRLWDASWCARDLITAVHHEMRAAPWVSDRALGRVARRMTCAFGQPGLTYRYSGTTKTAQPWHDATAQLADWVGHMCGGAAFNFCLGNLYETRAATLGWHADDERDLVAGAPIAIVSLGSPRVMGLRRPADGATREVLLSHGTLLVMAGATQRHWQHCIVRGVDDMPRISLTFRSVRS